MTTQKKHPPTIDFRRLFEAAPTPYLVLNPELTIVAVNDAYLEVTFTQRENIVGQALFDVFPDNPAEPNPTASANVRASLNSVLEFGRSDTLPVQKYDIPRPQEQGGGFAERYWSPINSPVFDEQGAIIYIIHRVEDVTDLIKLIKQRTAQFRTEKDLRARTTELETEMFLRAQELHRSNKQLLKANKSLAQLDQTKTQFFNDVSHEFRTPLTLILGPIEELLQNPDGLSSDQREHLNLIQRNALRLLKLVNSLLDFSQIEAGRMRAQYQATDLAAMTAELASVFRSALENAGLRFIVDTPPLPNVVYVDQEMWEKIVLNLLSNAFKFTLQGEIEVRLRSVDEQIRLIVRDTGSGIPEAEQATIFERFHRLTDNPGRTVGGSGIGLSLVSELVKLHGGEISVESTWGQGSTFTVTIPFGQEHSSTDHTDQLKRENQWQGLTENMANVYVQEAQGWLPEVFSNTAEIENNNRPTDAIRPRILLADDNTDMRGYITRLLSSRYDLEVVADGKAVLQSLRKRLPDLLITDLMMPIMGGLELLSAVRSDSRTAAIPVIILSGRADDEAKIASLEAGADDYLVKPFSARELITRIVAQLAQQAHIHKERASRKEAEDASSRLEKVLESVNDLFIALDHDWRIRYLNTKAADYLGQSKEQLIGKLIQQVMPMPQFQELSAELIEVTESNTPSQNELFDKTRQQWFMKRVYPSPEGFVVTFLDITDRKYAEEQIRHLAQHDSLTELPNRGLIYEFANHLLAHAERSHECIAFLFVDLDRFKPINDTHGHEVGDKLLKEVSKRLMASIRAQDIVGRFGGDEFLVVLNDVHNPKDTVAIAKHAMNILSKPFNIDGRLLQITPSIGISLYPQDGKQIDDLIKKADLAMYYAKKQGGRIFQFFTEDLNQQNRKLRSVENRMREGLFKHKFRLFYQPVVDTNTSTVVSAEALARWPKTDKNPVTPDTFIPAAETTGLIQPLSEWVFEESIRQHQAWIEKGLPPIPIAVNVSPVQFRQHHFYQKIARLMDASQINPKNFVIEVTESMLMEDIHLAIRILHRLKKLGIKIALDDFGTGYSSLGHLSYLPIDKIKIDKSFIARLHEQNTQAIVEAIIALGNVLGIEIIAEGIETPENLEFIQNKECHLVQGFLLCQPVPGDEFAKWYQQRQ